MLSQALEESEELVVGSIPTGLSIERCDCIEKISQHHTTLRDPTVECQCVRYFDIDDARRVLLIDQRCHKRAKITCKRTGGAAASAATFSYVCSMIAPPCGAEVPGKEDRAMSSTLSGNAQQTSSIVHNGT